MKEKLKNQTAESVPVALLTVAVYAIAEYQPLASWFLETPLLALALVFWLLRRHRSMRILCASLLVYILAGELSNPLRYLYAVSLIFAASLWTIPKEKSHLGLPFNFGLKSMDEMARWKKIIVRSALGVLLAVFFIAAVSTAVHMLNSKGRRHTLMKSATSAPETVSQEISELARNLESHVRVLAGEIGERDVYKHGAQKKALDYIQSQFEKSGYPVKMQEYFSKNLIMVKDGTPFYNVEALSQPDASPVWIIGAHYDSAPGTPGADDNASGVAVLLEAARLLKGKQLGKQIRFVAFGTEEPPAFGTKNMGSYHYARALADEKLKVRGMISLEMMGYYSSHKGSQTYPYILNWFFPDKGDFIGFVSNVSSWGLLRSCKQGWKKTSDFPLVTALLPGMLADIALSDQINFWSAGFPALMVSDTAYFRNPHYHSASDLPETLDYSRMARVTLALAGMLEKAE